MTVSTQPTEHPVESRIITGTLPLGWGNMHECTFCGALESALAATAHPADYITLMGTSALAFRMRWWVGHLGYQMFCLSGPVGEMQQEHMVLSQVTGWKLQPLTRFGIASPMVDQLSVIAQSIDAGLPVIAYHPSLDCAVIHGYQDHGRTLLVRDYYGGPDGVSATIDKIGPQITYLRDHQEGMPATDAAVQGIKLAVSQWMRDDGGPLNEKGQYLFGKSAYAGWIDALSRAGGFDEADRKILFQVNWWTFSALIDARAAAANYLRAVMGILPESASQALKAAADIYDQAVRQMGDIFQKQELFTGPWTGKTFNDWTGELRLHEQKQLHELLALDEQAIGHIAQALRHVSHEAAALGDVPVTNVMEDPGCDAGSRGGKSRKPAKPVRIPPPKSE